MINPSFHLFQLQKIDLKIDALSRRLMEITRIRNDHSARISIEQVLSKNNDHHAKQKETYSEIEEKIHNKKMKIEQSESSLYGGSIKNPKELQDLQSEIKSLKQIVATLEDIQLQQFMDLESSEQEIKLITNSLENFDEQLKNQLSALLSEELEKKTETDRLMQERKAVVDQVSSENIEIYNSLRKNKNGIALSTIEDGCCTVCGSTLTPSDCQTAKSPTRMATCSSCGRILYAG